MKEGRVKGRVDEGNERELLVDDMILCDDNYGLSEAG